MAGVRNQLQVAAPLDGEMTVEIGYRVTWDEEHTLGVRLRQDHVIGLCGSVLPP